MCSLCTGTYLKQNIACYSVFVQQSFIQSASSSCRQAIARNGMGGKWFLLTSVDDREEGRLSTVEVPVGDTGKRGACVRSWAKAMAGTELAVWRIQHRL